MLARKIKYQKCLKKRKERMLAFKKFDRNSKNII